MHQDQRPLLVADAAHHEQNYDPNDENKEGRGDEQITMVARATNRFQQGDVYRQIEAINSQGKVADDALQKLCKNLAKCCMRIPDRCLEPCSQLSMCLSIIVLLLYLAGIIWLYTFDIYELHYVDQNQTDQTTSIILNCDEATCLSNRYVCEYYAFDSCPAAPTGNVSNATNASSMLFSSTETSNAPYLEKFDLAAMVFIKIQYMISWITWSRVRWEMKDMSIWSLQFLVLVLFCNVISYMFRHLGWIYYSKDCQVMYSPYFSADFVGAIISFIISFSAWIRYVCEYYAFDSCPAASAGNVSNATNATNASLMQLSSTETNNAPYLEKFDLAAMVFIKIQYMISWITWSRVRWEMKDMSIWSLQFLVLVLFCNVISYMFRHLGWIYYSKDCQVIYSPYFSADFVGAIISFIISFSAWIVLLGLLMKRTEPNRDGNTRLILKRCGKFVDEHRKNIDTASVWANVMIWLFFLYAALGSAVWVGSENYEKNVEYFLQQNHGANSDDLGFTHWMGFVELFVTTVVQYFVPNVEWLSVYVIAAVATNVLLVLDVFIFCLKFIRDVVEKCERKQGNQRQDLFCE
eukprot:CAMPEP_0197075106 /NCGR_PEP_ID=MMETSP1384-20130603/211441_1 /TAXON_ID=29189 /ORGANISM="Ammonia sp." /LENGTH=577 /DNA_ID=CAMNT_0042513949 /DNA_START=42 /DNA_END=1775 /DNA_ORIENTATION=+